MVSRLVMAAMAGTMLSFVPVSMTAIAQSDILSDAGADPLTAARLSTYGPDYFTTFSPETALDMVAQIPGFTLRSGDGERGFGEADTNLLINGQRPSTKNQGADGLLSRIPAGTVKRIDLLDGAALDIPGLTGQVVNVIYTANEFSGRWRYAARFEEGTEPQLLEGEVVLSGKRGNLDFNLSIESEQFTFTEDSVEQFFDGDLTLIEDRTENIYFRQTLPGLDLNLGWTPRPDHILNLNGSFTYRNREDGVREIFQAITPAGATGRSEADGGQDATAYEFGGDYSFPLAAGRLKLIGLWRETDTDSLTQFVNAPEGQTPVLFIFGTDEEEGERIARAEYSIATSTTQDWQISGEYAFNFLDSVTRFETSATPEILDPVRVEEDRFDARLTHSWQLRPDISLQTSLGAEYSELAVVNPPSDARSFFRPKGFMALSYKADETWTARARIERDVGQLDFGTFVSSRSLADDLLTAGNEEIKPDQFWELSVELERTDDKLLSGTVSPYLRIIEDTIDRVLFADGSEGPGNLDTALRYGVEANTTLLFDSLGIPGFRLEAAAQVQDTEIDDPLTGQSRRISQSLEWFYEIEARYDIPNTNIALFGEVENDQLSPLFRLEETQQIFVDKPYLSVGLLHKNLFGLQVSVEATNLLNNDISRDRFIFGTEDLRLGPLTQYERFDRERGRRLSIVISDTF